MVGRCEVSIRVMRVNWECEGVDVKSGECSVALNHQCFGFACCIPQEFNIH